MYKIELTKEQAEYWKLCMEHKREIEALFENDVFSTRRAKVELHFDKLGKMSSIIVTKNIQIV